MENSLQGKENVEKRISDRVTLLRDSDGARNIEWVEELYSRRTGMRVCVYLCTCIYR